MSSNFIADPNKLLPPPIIRWSGLSRGPQAQLEVAARIATVKQLHQKFRRNYDLGGIEYSRQRFVGVGITVEYSRNGDQEVIDAQVTAAISEFKFTGNGVISFEFKRYNDFGFSAIPTWQQVGVDALVNMPDTAPILTFDSEDGLTTIWAIDAEEVARQGFRQPVGVIFRLKHAGEASVSFHPKEGPVLGQFFDAPSRLYIPDGFDADINAVVSGRPTKVFLKGVVNTSAPPLISPYGAILDYSSHSEITDTLVIDTGVPYPPELIKWPAGYSHRTVRDDIAPFALQQYIADTLMWRQKYTEVLPAAVAARGEYYAKMGGGERVNVNPLYDSVAGSSWFVDTDVTWFIADAHEIWVSYTNSYQPDNQSYFDTVDGNAPAPELVHVTVKFHAKNVNDTKFDPIGELNKAAPEDWYTIYQAQQWAVVTETDVTVYPQDQNVDPYIVEQPHFPVGSSNYLDGVRYRVTYLKRITQPALDIRAEVADGSVLLGEPQYGDVDVPMPPDGYVTP